MAVLKHHPPGPDGGPSAAMRPVEGSPIPSGPWYLTSESRYLTYDPTPLAAREPAPFVAQVRQEIREGFLHRMAFAAWVAVALYVLYILHKHQVHPFVFTELRSAR